MDGLWGVASGGEVRQWDPCSAAAQVEERGHGGLTMLSVESFRKLRSWVEVRYRRRCMCYTGRGCFIPQMMAVAESWWALRQTSFPSGARSAAIYGLNHESLPRQAGKSHRETPYPYTLSIARLAIVSD